MPKRQFSRSRKAWYDQVNKTDHEPEEFMLGFYFDEDDPHDQTLDGEIALRYHPEVQGWRLEAFDDSLLLVAHFVDITNALAAKGAAYSGDALEALLRSSGVIDKTSRVEPTHLKGHPLLKR